MGLLIGILVSIIMIPILAIGIALLLKNFGSHINETSLTEKELFPKYIQRDVFYISGERELVTAAADVLYDLVTYAGYKAEIRSSRSRKYQDGITLTLYIPHLIDYTTVKQALTQLPKGGPIEFNTKKLDISAKAIQTIYTTKHIKNGPFSLTMRVP